MSAFRADILRNSDHRSQRLFHTSFVALAKPAMG
jgi:hypothetical protein